jgi:hypothetical protein
VVWHRLESLENIFSSSGSSNYPEKVKKSKKKVKVFFMLLPTFGTLAKAHLWS